MRRLWWVWLSLLMLVFRPGVEIAARNITDTRPNVLVIMTDDQRSDTLTEQFMPNTMNLIAGRGVLFSRAYTSTSMCCPARAGFLTGRYARNNGVHVNKDQLREPTFVDHLHDSGYFTGLAGKYLNSWDGDPRPEFDFWAGFVRGDITDPEMNVNGEHKAIPGYQPHISRDHGLEFLDLVPDGKPFFLLYAPITPHAPATPAPGDEGLFSDLPPWRPPSFNVVNTGDPNWLRNKPPLTQAEIEENDKFRLDQLRCLHSLDLVVRDLLAKLETQGKLDNTLVIFLSDNGVFWGEHRLKGKNRVYEEASRIPMAIAFAAITGQAPRVEDRLVQIIDLAPTIYELAGLPIPQNVNGKSLVPLLRESVKLRDAILLEGWPGSFTNPRPSDGHYATETTEHYKAIRTQQYVYVQTAKDFAELYDTNQDPYQLNNLADNPDQAGIVKTLRRRLKKGPY